MPTFYTVSEAAQYIGRSTSAVRRILRPILKDDQHADRHYVQPSVDEVREIRMRGESFGWRISEELLDREVAARSAPIDEEATILPAGAIDPSLRPLVTLLRDELQKTHEQLKVKDQQIENLSELMKSLNERLREGNILIGSLQRQLALPEATVKGTPSGQSSPKASPAQASRPAAKKPEPKIPKPLPKKQPKKGFFARLFS